MISINQNNNNNTGIFYEIKDSQGTKGYIYGGAHLIFEDQGFNLNQRIKKAFQESTNFVLEVNIFKSEQLNIFGDSIEKKIEGLKECNPFKSTDLDFLIEAYESQKEIHNLEELQEQEILLDEHSREYSKNITERLESLSSKELTPEELKFKTEYDEISVLIHRAQRSSDEALVERVSKYGCSDELNKKIYDERNIKMADKIDHLLKSKGIFFITVGAGHVVGNEGIANLLRKKGWTLQKLEK